LKSCLQSPVVGVPTAANISAVASVLVGAFACDAPVTSAVAGDSAVFAAVGVF
jgi:hypothetical protein